MDEIQKFHLETTARPSLLVMSDRPCPAFTANPGIRRFLFSGRHSPRPTRRGHTLAGSQVVSQGMQRGGPRRPHLEAGGPWRAF